MNRKMRLILIGVFFALSSLASQLAAAQTDLTSNTTTVRGCLISSRGNYIVVEDRTGLAYALQGVDDRLNGFVGHEIEVSGQLRPGSMKTGVSSTKIGSNPSDTVHGIDGVPLQVGDVTRDVRMVAKKCTAADQQ